MFLSLRVRQVMGHLRSDDDVKAAIGERQRTNVGGHTIPATPQFQRQWILVDTGYAPVPAPATCPARNGFAQPAVARTKIENRKARHAFRTEPLGESSL